MRVDCGYFAVDLAIAAHRQGVKFAIGTKRLAPLWALLDDISESDRTEATWHARRPGRRRALLPAPGGQSAPGC